MICVQAGQCGNQLGLSLLNSLYDHLQPLSAHGEYNGELEAFFRPSDGGAEAALGFFGDYYASHPQYATHAPKLKARAVCIDTEPKVVNDVYSRSCAQNGWQYEANNVLYRHGGAGNNWALGYQMCGGPLLQEALGAVRQELEACDRAPCLLTLHSTAGGTGSGLGTRYSEALAERFPEVPRINVCVAPYHFGEVAVQHYNSVLCLAKTSAASDAVLLFENEVAQQLCRQMLRIDSPSLQDINSVLAGNMVPFLLPKKRYGGRAACSSLPDDVATLCAHPAYRFLETRCAPQTARNAVEFTYDKWESLSATVRRMLQAGVACERAAIKESAGMRCKRAIGSIFALRGPDAASAESAAAALLEDPVLRALHKPLLPSPMQVFHSPHAVNGYQRSVSALTNGSSCLPVLQRAAERAASMLRAGAYLHQYESYGLEQTEMVDCFRRIGQSIEDYKSLDSH